MKPPRGSPAVIVDRLVHNASRFIGSTVTACDTSGIPGRPAHHSLTGGDNAKIILDNPDEERHRTAGPNSGRLQI